MDTRWCGLHFLFIFLLLLENYAAFRQDGGCLFPERWEGTWFQSGVRQPIIIEGPKLSNKGICLASEGDKFLVVDDKRICYRCVVIHEKHANVLQYKETFCHERDSLPTLCRMITGDALLYSMFREGALPVPCPFRGPFTFTYNRGHGECRSPVSSIDICTEDSRLLLSYQACPDVYGTESTVEELECLATWKEGSSRYLVGKVHHSHATSNEDRFRCFVYEKTTPAAAQQQQPGANGGHLLQGDDSIDYRVAQSGDATCNGLFSATEGSRTMTLRRAPTLNRCRFPHWLAGSQHWHTLDYSATYSFHHRNSTLRITNASSTAGASEMKVVCAQIRHTSGINREESPVTIVTHFTMGCQSGYMCMVIYRRDSHVTEVQTGAHIRRPEDACSSPHFDKAQAPYITLVTTSPEPRQCPYMGKFVVTSMSQQLEHSTRSLRKRDWQRWRHTFTNPSNSGDLAHYNHRQKRVDHSVSPCVSDGFKTLVIGCRTIDTMEFYSDCPNAYLISSYSCHGRWQENDTHYLITTPLSRSSHGARRYCFIYREEREIPGATGLAEGGGSLMLVHFSSSSHSCDRNIRPGIEGALAFNATSTGKCVETNTGDRQEISLTLLLLTVLPIFINCAVFQTKR